MNSSNENQNPSPVSCEEPSARRSDGASSSDACPDCGRKKFHAEWCSVYEQKVMIAGLAHSRIMKAKITSLNANR